MPRRPNILLTVLLAVSPAIAWASDSYRGEVLYSPADLTVTKTNGFDLIELEDAGCLTTVGAPALPHTRINVVLPFGASVQEVRVRSIDTVDLKGTYDILPVSEPVAVSEKSPKNPFKRDAKVYNKNAFHPGRHIDLVNTWELVGQHFATLGLYPVQYNPVTRKARLSTRIEFEITYKIDKGTTRKTYNFSNKIRRHYQNRLRDLAFNPEGVEAIPLYTGSTTTGLEPGDYEYVLITFTTFKSQFQPLLEWRNQMGMPAKLVDPLYIYLHYAGATHQEMIRNFIIDAHATWGATYFLLGGDVNIVPCAWTSLCGEDIPNDTYYSDYDTDWICELYVGRASVTNSSQVTTFVDKVLTYEKSPPDNYGNTVFFMGFDLDGSTKSEGCKKSIKNLWVPGYADFDREYDSEEGEHIYDVINYMNQGYNLINHIDHCNTSFIGVACVNHGTGLGNGDAQNFTNGTRYGNFYSLGCWPGNYPDDCWGEAYTRDDQGGITFVGNSRSGWYNPGMVNTLSHKYEKKWWRALYDNNAYTAGDTLATSLNLYYPPDDLYKYIFTELNLLGDPGLHLWTKDPADPEVTHPTLANTGPNTFSVTVTDNAMPVEGALVCTMKDGEVYEVETTSADGAANLSIDPATTGELTLTVTAQNYRCYETQVMVVHAPAVASITPNIGMEMGYTPVTITGMNFTTDPPTEVRIGGNNCHFIDVQDENTITAVTPPGQNGWYDVEIESAYGGSTLVDGFRYFPTGGLPFNGLDVHGESIDTPQDVTLIISGPPGKPYSLFLSFGGGPLPTIYGTMGLDFPVMHVISAKQSAQGYSLLPMYLLPSYGPLDLYLHVLGLDTNGQGLWAYGGENPNGSGSVWIHVND